MSIEELFNKAKNLTISTINHVSNGLKHVKEDIKEQRLSICKSCDKFNAENTTCNECGCFLQIKSYWASEKCPLDKWGHEVSTDEPIDKEKIIEMRVRNEIRENLKMKSDCGCNKNNV